MGQRNWQAIAALWVLTVVVYANSWQAGLVYDNATRIVEDTRIQAATSANVDLIFNKEYWYPRLAMGLYRPLTTLSFLFNYAVLGNETRPAGYHAVNWILHSINATLLFLLLRELIGNRFGALAIASLWAVHPVLTESVTNIVGRADMMAAFAVLGALFGCMQASRSRGMKRWLWWTGAATACAIGAFAKESAIVVLPVMGLYELLLAKPAERTSRVKGYALLALPFAIFWVIRSRVFAGAAPFDIAYTDNPLAHANFFQAKLTAIKIIGKQLTLLAWPAVLSADYSYNQIPLSSWSDWKAWLSLIVLLGATVAGIRLYRRNPPVAFAIGFFFVTLAPTANLATPIGSPLAERFLYLPAMAFVACAAAAGAWALRRAPAGWVRAALILTVAALGARTFARNFDWKDEASLWRSGVVASPNSYRTHTNLAGATRDNAVPEIEKALAILDSLPDERNVPSAYTIAGARYREMGDRLNNTQSVDWYRKSEAALLRGRRIQDAYNAQAMRMRQELHDERIVPNWSPVYEELGKTWMRLSEFSKAAEVFRASINLKPTTEGFRQLSAAYYKGGDRAQAAIVLFEAVATDTSQSTVGGELSALYEEIDPAGCALERLPNGGRSLNLNCPLVRGHACAAFEDVVARHRFLLRPRAAAEVAAYAVNALGCAPAGFQPR